MNFYFKLIAFVVTIHLLPHTPTYAQAERIKKSEEIVQEGVSDKSIKIISDVINAVKTDYVNKVSEEKLVEAALAGIVSSLDPHSSYFNYENAKEMEMHTSGEFEGVGIDVTVENGLIKIISPIDGGPAEKAGIKSGDILISVDEESLHGLPTYEAIRKIRGKPGTTVKLSVFRDDVSGPLDFVLVREKIKIHSIKSKVLADDVLYIRLSYFYGNTANALIEEMKKYVKNNHKPRGLILDLRNNPGGLLDQAVKVSSVFLDQGDIVSTKGRIEASTVNYAVQESGFKIKDIPIVVLINNGTASASEIVASALQDHKRAVLLGTRSFGKGSVQEIINIGEGRVLALTTSLYYTPSGRSIQIDGVTPDILVEEQLVKKQKVFREENLEGHLERDGKFKRLNLRHKATEDKSTEQNIPANYSDDHMLIRAVDLIKGISIYGINDAVKISKNIAE